MRRGKKLKKINNGEDGMDSSDKWVFMNFKLISDKCAMEH